jgi:hypothetical protein
MQCSNKLKQLGLSCHTYHDAKNEFPANGDTYGPYNGEADGSVNSGSGLDWAKGMSAWIFILPFMEQTARYDNWMIEYETNWAEVGPGAYGDAPDAQAAVDARQYYGVVDRLGGPSTRTAGDPLYGLRWADADFMACPSDGNGNKEVTEIYNNNSYLHRTGNYVVNGGDTCVKTEGWGNYGGKNGDTDPDVSGFLGRGAFKWRKTTALSDISDGLSNTALATERACGTNGTNERITVDFSVRTSVKAYIAVDAQDLILYSGGNWASFDIRYDAGQPFIPRLAVSLTGTQPAVGFGGTRWYSSEARYTWAFFITPPNSPSVGANTGGDGPRNNAFLPPTSYHTGGVNAVVADGSVRFVSDTVDWGSPADDARNSISGPSIYGVWGAFGSAAGGESASLP